MQWWVVNIGCSLLWAARTSLWVCLSQDFLLPKTVRQFVWKLLGWSLRNFQGLFWRPFRAASLFQNVRIQSKFSSSWQGSIIFTGSIPANNQTLHSSCKSILLEIHFWQTVMYNQQSLSEATCMQHISKYSNMDESINQSINLNYFKVRSKTD
jgi:hypothetical protein